MARKMLRGLVVVTTFCVALTTAAASPSMARDPEPPNAPDALMRDRGVVTGVAGLSPEVARTVNGAGAGDYERALSAYWTPERMRAARPAEQVRGSKEAAPGKDFGGIRVSGGTRVPGELRGEPVVIPPARPATTPIPAGAATGVAATAGAAGAVGTTAIGPFRPRYAVGHPVARTIGRVFFTHMGEDLVCSAGIVNSASKSLVWTAGHCVADDGHFAQNWIFVPNYNMDHSWPQSPAPYGYWYARYLSAPGEWTDHRHFHSDWGAAVVWPNGSGTRIQDYLGAQGISFSLPYFPFGYAYGYPADPPYDGEYLYLAIAQAHDAGASVMYMENSMTGGSSGGYWLTNFDGEFGVVNGHNSFGLPHQPQYTYSPYYGLSTVNFYNLVQAINPMA